MRISLIVPYVPYLILCLPKLNLYIVINLSFLSFSPDIMWDELHGRSGSIQAALNLELATDSIHQLNIKAEGLNGQLPNLDLINTVVRLCRRETVAPALQKRVRLLFHIILVQTEDV